MEFKLPKIPVEHLHRIDQYEIDNAEEQLITFFENNPLKKCYEKLWELVFGFSHSDFASDGEEVGKMLHFYVQLESLLEILYMRLQQKQELI